MKAFAFTDLLHTGIPVEAPVAVPEGGGFLQCSVQAQLLGQGGLLSPPPGKELHQAKGQRHQRKQRPIEKIHPKIPFC